MALRNILMDKEPVLRKKSRPVTEFGPRTAQLMDDLRETMVAAEGAGLAAPQVGILRRAAVILRDQEIVELINPVIISRSAEQVGLYEGCLSFPGKRGYLQRPQKVVVRAQDRTGKPFELECEDMAARAVCHETDHLDGIVFVNLVERVYTDEELELLLAQEDEDSGE